MGTPSRCIPKILEALSYWSRSFKAEWASYASQSEQKLSEDELKKIRAAYAEIDRAIDLGSFLLSDEAADCLRNLKKGLETAESIHKDDYLGYLADSQGDVDDCLKNMREIAKKDIKKLII